MHKDLTKQSEITTAWSALGKLSLQNYKTSSNCGRIVIRSTYSQVNTVDLLQMIVYKLNVPSWKQGKPLFMTTLQLKYLRLCRKTSDSIAVETLLPWLHVHSHIETKFFQKFIFIKLNTQSISKIGWAWLWALQESPIFLLFKEFISLKLSFSLFLFVCFIFNITIFFFVFFWHKATCRYLNTCSPSPNKLPRSWNFPFNSSTSFSFAFGISCDFSTSK